MSELEAIVGAEVLSQIGKMVKLNEEGGLRPSTRAALQAALRRASRRIAGKPGEAADRAAAEHVERMRPAALGMFDDQIAKLTDGADRRAEIHSKAESADTESIESLMLIRNEDLVESIRSEAIEKLEAHMMAALMTRGTKDERIARAIAGADLVFTMTQGRADRIAAWESDTMNTEYASRFNFVNEIGEYDWITQRDSDVRPLHEQRDGDRFRWADPPQDGDPGVAPGCRCEAVPVLESRQRD